MGEREHHPGKTFGGVGTYWARSRSVPTPAYSRAPGGGVETPVAGFGSLPSEFRLSLNMRHCPWCQRTCTKFNLPTLLPYTRIPRGQAEGFPVFPSFPPCGQAEGFPIFLSSPHGCPKPPSLLRLGPRGHLIHFGASNSIGIAGVSDKCHKRSWARYPALWTLKHVGSLQNPDAKPVSTKNIAVDQAAEAKRPKFKRQAQEWAGIAQNLESGLFMFAPHTRGADQIAAICIPG